MTLIFLAACLENGLHCTEDKCIRWLTLTDRVAISTAVLLCRFSKVLIIFDIFWKLLSAILHSVFLKSNPTGFRPGLQVGQVRIAFLKFSVLYGLLQSNACSSAGGFTSAYWSTDDFVVVFVTQRKSYSHYFSI